MKTLCYEIIFRCKGYVYNEGFIINIGGDNKILRAEGLLTSNYLRIAISESNFNIEIYSLYDFLYKENNCDIVLLENSKMPMVLIFKSTLPLGELEIPFDFKILYPEKNLFLN